MRLTITYRKAEVNYNATNCILVGMDPKLKSVLRRYSKLEGVSMGEFIRTAVRQSVRQKKAEAGSPASAKTRRVFRGV